MKAKYGKMPHMVLKLTPDIVPFSEIKKGDMYVPLAYDYPIEDMYLDQRTVNLAIEDAIPGPPPAVMAISGVAILSMRLNVLCGNNEVEEETR